MYQKIYDDEKYEVLSHMYDSKDEQDRKKVDEVVKAFDFEVIKRHLSEAKMKHMTKNYNKMIKGLNKHTENKLIR